VLAGTLLSELLEPYRGQRARVIRLLETSGIWAPRYGPRLEPCHPTIYECNGSLLVERVTWADGEPFDPGPVFDAGLEVPAYDMANRNLDSAENLAIGRFGTVLMAALVRPSWAGGASR